MFNPFLRQFLVRLLTRRATAAVLTSFALSVAFSAPASAANTLNVPAQYATIQAAITAAAVGDTVLIADGTYTGVGNVALDFGGKDIIVKSVNGAATTIIDCQGSAASVIRAFHLGSGETPAAKVDGFTIKGNGGISVAYGSPTIANCVFTGNANEFNGGAIDVSSGEPVIDHCRFINNSSLIGNGGAIYAFQANPNVSNCLFTTNSAASSGGAIYVYKGSVTAANCRFSGNSCSGYGASGGGGIGTENGNITVTSCNFTNNSAPYGGGVEVFADEPHVSTITNCTFNGNIASQYGGGIAYYYLSNNGAYGGSDTLMNCTFHGNSATAGDGGVYAYYTNPFTTNCIFNGDTGGEIGGQYGIPFVTYSDVQGGCVGTGNIDADPVFVNPATGDLHLQASSPCIGVGTPSGAPAVDADGVQRPNPPSLGAYDRPVNPAAPRIISLNPTNGGVGTVVTITGVNFTGASSVKFGATPATTFTLLSASQISAAVPLGATTGRISVITSYGTATSVPFFVVTSPAVLKVPSQFGTIQAAINAAPFGSTVLVDDGTYIGAGNTNLDLGGKDIKVTSVNGAAKTIIDCQGSLNNLVRGFDFHSGETAAAKVDGFTIRKGYAEPGGGIHILNSNPTIRHCIFSNNAIGAVSLINSTSLIDNCIFIGNGIGQDYVAGGAMSANASISIISNCTFEGNQAIDAHGGAIFGYGDSNITIENCTFTGNSTLNIGSPYGDGGAIATTGGVATLTNCTFDDNTASFGGAVYADWGSVTITNCTFQRNLVTSYGGSIEAAECNPTITNCIMYGDNGGEISLYLAAPVVSYSDVQGGYAGTGNIAADPLFVDPAGGDFHLQMASPCFGAGTPSGAPAMDADGNLRPNPPSMGAFDLAYTAPTGGRPDLVLQNTISNQMILWNMNSATVAGRGYVSLIPPSGWTAVAEGDFNGDGKLDLVLQNGVTNQIALWYLNGATLIGGAYVGTTPAAGWSVVGSGDFNGDGKRDLVLQNTATNQIALWYLNGTNVTGGAYVSSTPAAGWHVVACGDFNGDGKQDIALQNANTRQIALWFLNGASLVSGGYVSATPGAGWSVMGSGDFNGDGKRDLILQNVSTNQAALWYLNGLTLTGGAYTSIAPGVGWTIVGPR